MRTFIAVLVFLLVSACGGQKVLHPDFPVVEGRYQMTPEWYVTLGQPYNRRFEDGSLVLWRPGFTIWVNIWNNDNNQSIDERLEWISSEASPDAFEVRRENEGEVLTYSYRLNETETGTLVYSYSGYVLAKDSHVQISVYFDSEIESEEARSVIDSIQYVQP